MSEVRAPIRIRTASDSVLIPGKRGFARGSKISLDLFIRGCSSAANTRSIERQDVFAIRPIATGSDSLATLAKRNVPRSKLTPDLAATPGATLLNALEAFMVSAVKPA